MKIWSFLKYISSQCIPKHILMNFCNLNDFHSNQSRNFVYCLYLCLCQASFQAEMNLQPWKLHNRTYWLVNSEVYVLGNRVACFHLTENPAEVNGGYLKIQQGATVNRLLEHGNWKLLSKNFLVIGAKPI